MQPKKNRF